MIFKKGTKLYSILRNKCPKCQEGDFFKERNLLQIKNLLALNENCSHCQLKYMMEPAFYYGAMFVNYALTVAIAVASFVIAFVFLNLSLIQSFIAIVCILALSAIYTLRLSRIIWINLFVKYQKSNSTTKI